MEKGIEMNHAVITQGREKLNISGVKDVLSFDEETFLLDTVAGRMTVKGENLHILSFHTESGDLSAEGRIHAFAYLSDNKSGGMISKLFR